MKSLFRIWQSAACEWFSAVRSRRALVVVLLYLAASLLSMNSAISGLAKMETHLAEMLQLPSDGKSGVVSTALWKSKRFQRTVHSALGESLVYDDICGRHPAELLYAWLAFMFIPILTVLVAGNRVADDLHSGAVRYMITRVTRFEWSLGKYIGSALLLLPALLIGALAAWGVAAYRLAGSDVFELLPPMLVWSVKGWFLSLGYLGIALGVSHFTQSGAKATALGIVALVVFLAMPKVITHFWPGPLEHLNPLFPSVAADALWRSSLEPVACSACWLLLLGLFYLTLGYAYFARRDAR